MTLNGTLIDRRTRRSHVSSKVTAIIPRSLRITFLEVFFKLWIYEAHLPLISSHSFPSSLEIGPGATPLFSWLVYILVTILGRSLNVGLTLERDSGSVCAHTHTHLSLLITCPLLPLSTPPLFLFLAQSTSYSRSFPFISRIVYSSPYLIIIEVYM